MTQTTKLDVSSVADEVIKLQGEGKEGLKQVAADLWARLAPTMGLTDWEVTVDVVSSSGITTDDDSDHYPLQMATIMYAGPKRVTLLVSSDYPFHKDNSSNFVECIIHEMLHVVLLELGVFELDGDEEKRHKFGEQACDRFARILGGLID